MRRLRFRRLSRRGRLTLFGLGLGVAAGFLSLSAGPVTSLLAADEVAPDELPPGELPPVGMGPRVVSPPVAPDAVRALPPVSAQTLAEHFAADAEVAPPIIRWVSAPSDDGAFTGPLRVEYAMDPELTRKILGLLRRGRVKRGHVVVIDPRSGRLLAYVSTDEENFPPERSYPAASLVKLITAAAALDRAPEEARRPCLYRGNPYRLTRSRVNRPKSGREISFEKAMATSNNQCFAQLAVHTVGARALQAAIARFGWLESPAPGHAAGTLGAVEDDYDLGRLGSGLSATRITPLHAGQLAATLARGQRLEPWWVSRVVDAKGTTLALPMRPAPMQVMTPELAAELRQMLVRTTRFGTAKSAFRDRRGRPLLGSIAVSGKTGNLSGSDPEGRYEWFAGVAPADQPSIAIAVVQVHGDLWWMRSSETAASILKEIFCERGRCQPELARRYTGSLNAAIAPALVSGSGR